MDILDEYTKGLHAPDSYASIREVIDANIPSAAIEAVKMLTDALEQSEVPPAQARKVLVNFCKRMSRKG